MLETVIEKELESLQQLQSNLERCILGKSQEIRLLITALLAGGHVLMEDVPGTGKTVLMKALAKSINGQYRRIQCNPDLLPTDITGVAIYHPKHELFIYRPGPVMANIVLADEINRATTKTQAALLEAMEEHHVTVDGETHELPDPFMLLATQNPIDFEGTYTLPEAQLDRFMIKLSIGYPDLATEKQMVAVQSGGHPLAQLQPTLDADQVAALRQTVGRIHMDDAVVEYIVNLVRATREHASILLGASPRATLALVQAAKAYALLQGRDFVIPDDIKLLTPYVLGHRLILNQEARIEGMHTHEVLQAILSKVKVPIQRER